MLHALLALSLAALPAPVLLRSLLGAALLIHAFVRLPRKPPALLRRSDGTWTVPALGLRGLHVGRGSSCAPGWIRLVLVRPGTRRALLRVVLVEDQLGADGWRTLQATLRRARGPEAG